MLSYTLTNYTGSRKNDGRATVVMTVEVQRHTILVSVISVLASVIPTFVVFVLMGPWAVVCVFICVIGGNYLFASRQRRGLQVYRYRTLWDSKVAARGFWINGAAFANPEFIMHVQTVIPTNEIDEHHASRREVGDRTPKFVRGVKDSTYEGEYRVGVRDRLG